MIEFPGIDYSSIEDKYYRHISFIWIYRTSVNNQKFSAVLYTKRSYIYYITSRPRYGKLIVYRPLVTKEMSADM